MPAGGVVRPARPAATGVAPTIRGLQYNVDPAQPFPAGTTHLDSVLRWECGKLTRRPDELAAEEPLEIRVRGRPVSVTMRTPGHDEELAAGFLLTEGIIRRRADVLRIEPCGRNEEGNLLNVQLAPEVPVDFAQLTRHVFASSSCGLCGKATIEAVRAKLPPIDGAGEGDVILEADRIDVETIAAMPEAMRRAQAAFDLTGGLHAAGLVRLVGQPAGAAGGRGPAQRRGQGARATPCCGACTR